MPPTISGQRSTLPRKREAGVQLPEGVERSVRRKKNGKVYVYYYWNPGRSTKRQRDRIKLPDPNKDLVAFSREVARLQNSTVTACPAGSIGDPIAQYRDSEEFKKDSARTSLTTCDSATR